MTERQLPNWSKLRPLLRPRPVAAEPDRQAAARALTIADLRRAARRRTPRSVFDYTDGAAEAEISLRRARQLFRDLEFRPQILQRRRRLDTATTVLGKPSALPFPSRPPGSPG